MQACLLAKARANGNLRYYYAHVARPAACGACTGLERQVQAEADAPQAAHAGAAAHEQAGEDAQCGRQPETCGNGRACEVGKFQKQIKRRFATGRL